MTIDLKVQSIHVLQQLTYGVDVQVCQVKALNLGLSGIRIRQSVPPGHHPTACVDVWQLVRHRVAKQDAQTSKWLQEEAQTIDITMVSVGRAGTQIILKAYMFQLPPISTAHKPLCFSFSPMSPPYNLSFLSLHHMCLHQIMAAVLVHVAGAGAFEYWTGKKNLFSI